jgi:hypothetical protein
MGATAKICSVCSNTILDDAVVLWDGQLYCGACVLAASADLLHAVRAQQPLSETIPGDSISGLRAIGWHFLPFAIVICVLAFAALVSDVSPLHMLIGFTLGCLVILGLTPLLLITARLLRAQYPRSISIKEGQVVFETPSEKTMTPLQECCWFPASTLWEQDGLFLPFKSAVIIETPRRRIACGLTDQQRSLWLAFLKLARVARRPQYSESKALALIVGCTGAGYLIGIGLRPVFAFLMAHAHAPWVRVFVVTSTFLGFVTGMMYYSALLKGEPGFERKLTRTRTAFAFGFVAFSVFVHTGAGIVALTAITLAHGLVGMFIARDILRRVSSGSRQRRSGRYGVDDTA